MKTWKYFIYIMSGVIWICSACSSDNNIDEPLPEPDDKGRAVEVITEVQTRATATLQYKEGDEMCVIAKAYNQLNADNFAEPTKGVYRGGGWTFTAPIRLQEGEHTFIFALSPWQASIPKDLSAIPLDLNKQQDVLYSGRAVPVSYTTYQARLTMKHALALASFNISKLNYAGKGELQKVVIAGDGIYSSATLNMENGRVTGNEAGKLSCEIRKTVLDNGWNSGLPGIWTVPFTTKSTIVRLTATIDGKDYEISFPEVEMKGGYQYLFHLILTSHGLTFAADETKTISLNQQEDEMTVAQGYGVLRITHTAQQFTLPTLSGNSVYGNVNWGDQQAESYQYGMIHSYTSSQSHELLIESWNSTGFQLSDLTGVEAIDLSGYLP